MSVSIVFKDPIFFRKLIDSIKVLVSETNLNFSSSGIALKSMDSSHVALVDMLLSRESKCIETFNCSVESIDIGVKLDTFAKILHCGGEKMTLVYDTSENPDVLQISFEGKNAQSSFDMKLLNLDVDILEMSSSDEDYPARYSLHSADFSKIFTELDTFGDLVQLKGTSESLSFSVKNETLGNGLVKVVLNPEKYSSEEDSIALACSIRYLVMFAKATILTDHVEICISDDMPLVFLFKFDQSSFLKFYLAPKIAENTL